MQLSGKQKTFSEFLSSFLKSRLDLEHFEKKGGPHRFCISKITKSENVVRSISKKERFRGSFEEQHGKHTKTLSKYALQHLYHTYW